ncbi:MAG: phosphotransferase [Anaerolineaceae bacterium]|nr:phosphotransferase [Anaerolineaceae bacterium]
MEPHIAKKFKKEHLLQAANMFDIQEQTCQELDGFENFIYEGQRNDKPVILRLSHSSKKDRDQIGSELAFVNYLAQNGADAAQPLPARNGDLIREIALPDHTYFSAVCFQKAPGHHPIETDYNTDLYLKWGAAMGKMHRLSRQYNPPVEQQRIHWYEEIEITRPGDFLPPSQEGVIEMMAEYTRKLHGLPVSRQNYGVVHNDLHPYNYLYDGQQITMIDFEDAVQMWYMADLVSSLFMVSVWPPNEMNREDFTRSFWPFFLRGYREQNDIPESWIEEIPLFLKFRELGQYVAMYRACDMQNLDPWVAHFLNGRQQRIEEDLLYIEIEDWQMISG